ncbi:MAG: phosphoribosyltransferase family protein, partial [Gaiellaceae bacterium]
MTTDLREHMTWDDLGAAVGELAAIIDADRFRPDAVLALARGGLPCAGALAYALDVKSMATLNVEFYTGVDER